MTTGLRLGAPGVYRVAPGAADTDLRPVALDAAGFAGVAPRGPVDVPVAVRSWPEYLARFGLGPGLLPLAVSAFFAQGGRRAYVLRVGPPPSAAAHALIGQGTYAADGRWIPLCAAGNGRALPVRWLARDEGAWANGLTVTLEAVLGQRFTVDPAASSRALAAGARADADRVVLPPAGVRAPAGSLLHVRTARGGGRIRWIDAVSEREVAHGIRRTAWVLDAPLPTTPLSLGLVHASVVVDDHAPEGPSVESFAVGLSPRHPQWLASVVGAGSRLVAPDPAWADAGLRIALTDPLLPPVTCRLERPGEDRYGDIGEEDLLGRSPSDAPDDDPAGERPHRGVERLAQVAELGLLAVPDLAWNGVVPAEEAKEPPDPPPDRFAPCPPPQRPALLRTAGAAAAYLDGRLPEELAGLRARQEWLVRLADTARRFVVLTDVPQGLSAAAAADWRTGFDSSYAAAYHPWLGVLPPRLPSAGRPAAGETPTARLVPPSAFAAGIIAAREIAAGLPAGPANELAAGAVKIADRITDTEHAALHPLGINVFRAERDGFRLTAARTLSHDPDYRQLTVRRLMTMLRLTLDRESQWVVFEPHTAALRTVLVLHISDLLRGQFQAGAFTGATEAESFFIRADADLNPPGSVALGRIVLEVGVAPSSPLEFLVLRLTRGSDTIDIQEAARG
ncbi:phage tail sheath family protein [Streptomyces phaeochromogenes]|uniref:phage tail sheath family protein n=1 Tax=Streptomyces phaeochromogenes TaxID=1923 RepID=UPI002E15CA6C|nr:phage tail sheath subtilisin-like domain-containing protein [Streptomyces phaeochromogenes]